MCVLLVHAFGWPIVEVTQFLDVGHSTARWVLALAAAPDVPTQSYRSTDGEIWTAVGAPSVRSGGGVFAAGGRLFSVTEPTRHPTYQPDRSWTGTDAGTHVITSTDGLNWVDAIGLPDDTGFERLTHINGRYFGSSGSSTWWSSIDGLSWRQLPVPGDGGLIALGARVVLLANPGYSKCQQSRADLLPGHYEAAIAAL